MSETQGERRTIALEALITAAEFQLKDADHGCVRVTQENLQIVLNMLTLALNRIAARR